MRTKLNLISTHLLSSLFLISTLLSCGSYQTVSYYASDGIYGGEAVAKAKPEQPKTETNTTGVYYKDYFSNVADDYSSIDNPQNYTFTETDSYSSNNGNSNVRVNSQAPWRSHKQYRNLLHQQQPLGIFQFQLGILQYLLRSLLGLQSLLLQRFLPTLLGA